MNRTRVSRLLTAAAIAATAGLAHAQSIDCSFTYQGYVEFRGEALDGIRTVHFRLFNAPAGGVQVGSEYSDNGIVFQNGRFSMPVDFGETVFRGQPLWLEVGFSVPGGSINWISPRQEITATPYASFAKKAGMAEMADFAEDADVSLTDAYMNDPILDASMGDLVIRNSNGGLFDPATLQVGGFGGEAGGEIRITSSNGGDVINMEASGSDNAGIFQLRNAVGTPIINLNRDGNGGGFMTLYRRDGSGTGSAIGFEVNGSFGSSESTRVTVRGADRTMFLATDLAGDDSVQFDNDAINAEEILNETGVAADTSTGTTLTPVGATIDVVAQQTIVCPTDGFVLVLATAEADITHLNGTQTNAVFALSSTSATYSGSRDIELLLGNSVPGGSYDFPVTVHSVFPVSPGSRTFYFLGDQQSTSGSMSIFDVSMSAIFIPTTYGGVTTPASTFNGPDIANGAFGGLTPQQSFNEQLAAESAENDRIRAEMAKLRARIERMELENATERK